MLEYCVQPKIVASIEIIVILLLEFDKQHRQVKLKKTTAL